MYYLPYSLFLSIWIAYLVYSSSRCFGFVYRAMHCIQAFCFDVHFHA